jgi:hypothetical protein
MRDYQTASNLQPGFMSAPQGGPDSPGTDRRGFLRTAAAAGLGSMLDGRFDLAAAETVGTAPTLAPTESTIGSLFPFIESQAVKGEFPLSFLNSHFQSLVSWKKTARGKLLELLNYAPAACNPAAETVERVDCGDYVCERVRFNTTPEVRVPAFVLVPKNAPKPAPAIVALHDHGGFYFWGKEKIVEMPNEHPALGDFRKQYYGGRAIASELARQGYIVAVIDMFYWGERRMLLDDDAPDWRERPASLTHERIQAFNSHAGQNEQVVARTIYAAGFTWPGVMFWDDVRTVDYLLTRPDVDRQRIGCVGLSPRRARRTHPRRGGGGMDDVVSVAAQETYPQHDRLHQNRAGPLPAPGLSRRGVAGDAHAATGHQRREGRLVPPGRREGEFREAQRLLRQGRRARPLPPAVV